MDDSQNTTLPPLTEENAVKRWMVKIKAAKEYFDGDFKRMRDNMEFAAGLQLQAQTEMAPRDEKYIANFITHFVNDKVASLYARDPKCEAVQRKRLDYQLWDGKVETSQQAIMIMSQAAMTGQQSPQSIQAAMLLQDIEQGKQMEEMCEKIGDTLEVLYQYQQDSQQPSFKYQMKQLVRRVITTGVGYVRMNFVRQFDSPMTSQITDDSLPARLKKMKYILSEIQEDDISENDPAVEQLRLLVEGIQASVQSGDAMNVQETIEFDFPSATSIIVDPRCKALKGFIGAEWIAQQFIMPLSTANAYFELSGDQAITTGGQFVEYADNLQPIKQGTTQGDRADAKDPMGCFYEVFDYTTKTHFFVCEGWKWYVQEPQPVSPETDRFWPIFALTFNDVEVEVGQKCHIYPPSDVQLLKPMQMERNRSRQEMIDHRKVNRPFFWGLNSAIDEKDLDKLANHETGEFIPLKNALVGSSGQQDVINAIGKWTGIPIDQNLYTSLPLNEDVNMVSGSNSIQQQEPIRHVAATPAVIQEQARVSNTNSNVDDLDDMLSDMAETGGQIMLRSFSPQTVVRIVGRGAVWPQDNMADFLDGIQLTVIAASSGRPNKAVDIANFERIAPILQAAGANPIAIVEEAVKRLDDRLDVSKFFPVPVAPMMAQQQPQQGGMPIPAGGIQPPANQTGTPPVIMSHGQSAQPPQGGQPLQQMAAHSPMPIPGHGGMSQSPQS